MAAKFIEVFRETGFDPTANPPWTIVGLQSQDAVQLVDGPDLQVVSRDPSMVEVQEAEGSRPGLKTRKFWLRGKKLGLVTGKQRASTFVEAISSGNISRPEARLEVCVKQLKTVKIAFNFVWDSAKPPHHTKRNEDEVPYFLRVLNAIYLPQARVHFIAKNIRKVVASKDLGDVVRWTHDGKNSLPGVPRSAHTWDDVVALGDKTADFNVFFVWEYEADATPHHDDHDAGTWGSNCLFEDNITSDGSEVSHDATGLAHEVLHFFYGPDVDHETDPTNRSRLWYKDATRGTFISKKDANAANL